MTSAGGLHPPVIIALNDKNVNANAKYNNMNTDTYIEISSGLLNLYYDTKIMIIIVIKKFFSILLFSSSLPPLSSLLSYFVVIILTKTLILFNQQYNRDS